MTNKTLKPPKGLSYEARTLWKDIQSQYQIDDPGGLRLLQTAVECLDAMRAAEAQVKTDGLMIVINDRLSIHPAGRVVKESRAQMLQALKMLNLDLEPLKNVGRPPGS